MKHLIVLRGLPCAGKSYLAQRLGRPVVNSDAVRQEMFGEPDLSYEKSMEVRTEMGVRAKALLAAHPVVVVDSTNLTASARAFWQTVAEDAEARMVLVWVYPERKELIARLKARPVPDGEPESYWVDYAKKLWQGAENAYRMGIIVSNDYAAAQLIALVEGLDGTCQQ